MARRLAVSSNLAFWVVVIGLAFGTVFFASNVEEQRARLRGDNSLQLESGQVVQVVRVIDADELTVRTEEGKTFVVRLIGVKGFTVTINEPGLSGLGQAAMAQMQEVLADKKIHIVFDELATDRSGRVLAYLEADGADVGEQMVRRGHLVVYTRYPFSREELYLGAEAEARTKRTGLWGNYKAVSRVQGWQDSWTAAREAE